MLNSNMESVPLGSWHGRSAISPESYRCGYCDREVATAEGYTNHFDDSIFIALCPNCGSPTYFTDGKRIPGSKPGNNVKHLPADLERIYNEIRLCIAATAFTSAVLTTRKMLMHIAVEQGADKGKSFLYYVEYLDNNNYIPPKSHAWVDYMRLKGNEANHEIVIMNEEDAVGLLRFLELLLRFIYEFPNEIPPPPPKR